MTTRSTSEKIAVAARQLLDREGADAVTMRRVATEVGITAMAIYRHYPNRAGLLNVLADEGFIELSGKLTAAKLTGGTEKRLEKLLDVFLDHHFH